MISELTIKNFRSIEDLTIKLGPINFFIGPNNSGKSNIMKALSLCLGDMFFPAWFEANTPPTVYEDIKSAINV